MEQDKRIFFTSILLSLAVGSLAGLGTARYALRTSELSPAAYVAQTMATGTRSTMLPTLASEEQRTLDVVRQTVPAVVSISISKEIAPGRRPTVQNLFPDLFGEEPPFFFEPRITTSTPSARRTQKVVVGGGSGFFVSQDGYVITNKHVVSDKDAEYTVVTQDQKKYPAKVLALDPTLDLAVLKVEGSDFPFVTFGDSDAIVVGQTVIAIGNALAEFQNTVTKGIVSGLNRRIEAGDQGSAGTGVIEQAIQTDAAINFGNSGGPLLDLMGQVVGVNTAVSQDAQSLGFALPSNVIRHALESVQKNGRIVRPWIGIRYVQIDEEFAKKNNVTSTYGVLISKGPTAADVAIIPGSPAEKAGLVEKDIILSCNGIKLDGQRSLAAIIAGLDPGHVIRLQVLHKGQEKTIELTLEERKETI